MATKSRGLTPKQRHFAQLVASGKNGSEAYRGAYNTNGKAQTCAQRAWELMQREDIKHEIEVLNARKEAAIIRKSLNDRERVLSKLRDWTETATPQDSNKIRAAELLGKSIGLFKDVSLTDPADNLSADDLRKELQAKLASVMNGPKSEN